MMMEYRAREAEMIAARILEDSERRAKEAEQLQHDLIHARRAEQSAKERLMEVCRASPSYQVRFFL